MSSSATERGEPARAWSPLGAAGMAVAIAGLTTVAALRRPTAFTDPTIWAEDGAVFMAVAWQGPGEIVETYAGQAWPLQRLIALAIGALPATWWPVALYLVACLGVALVAAVPLLPRARELFGALPYRVLLAFLIVLLPGTFEAQGNITNLHWWATGALFMLAAMPAPAGRVAKVGELTVIALLGLTGPVALFALPVALWRLVAGPRTSRYLLARALVLAAASVVVILAVFSSGRVAGNAVLLSDIPAYLYVKWGGTLALGESLLASGGVEVADAVLLLGGIIIAVLLVLAVTDLRGPSWLWLAIGVLAAVMGALVGMRSGAGAALLEPRNVTRYAVPLLLASMFVLVRGLAVADSTWRRVLAGGALALALVGVVADARLPPAGPAVQQIQLAQLRPCFEGEQPFADAIACTVDIAPAGWQLVVFRPGYESLREELKGTLGERAASSR